MEQSNDAQTRRMLRQHLELLQQAGLTHLPRSEFSPDENLEEIADTSTAATDAAIAVETSTATQPATRTRSLFVKPEESPLEKAPVKKMERSTLSTTKRIKKLQELQQCVAQCTRCEELVSERTQTVFGVGNPEARILFLGEAPGADEDRQGEPFVGRAGQLLNKIITASKLTREDVYICNILRCRPPGNRNPSNEEAANCREHLDGQIATVDPDYIVCLGSVAARNLLDTTAAIGRLRGKFFNHGRAKVLCTYHPSYLLRNPAAKKDVWEDMKILMRDMGVDLEST